MLRNVYLYGHLAEEFGSKHTFDIASPTEAIRALNANFPKFISKFKDYYYAIVKGDDLETGKDLSLEEVKMNFGKGDFHIVPVVEGGKSGWFNIIFGALLLIVSIWFPPAGLAATSGMFSGMWAGGIMMGAGLMLSGITQLMTPTPSLPDLIRRESPDERPSFVFNGPVNVSEQGGPIPIVYGEFIIGSTLISAGIEVEEV